MKKLRYKKERGFYIPHFMESFMKCGVFFCKNIPVICPNYFTVYCA